MSAMTVEAEQVVERRRPTWRTLLAGFLLGILASFLVLVVLAFKYGPRGESTTVDLYSGHVITHKFFLWKRSRISGPEFPHVRWAIQHQTPVRSWYIVGSSMSRAGWFEPMVAVSYTTREYVYDIYRLQLPNEEKIKLLHQHHEELDALKLKQQEHYESGKFMERFYKDWERRLEKVAEDGQLAADSA
jgi:hypothetical protein